LVTYYSFFVIELHSRRVDVVGPTRRPDEAFVVQAGRHVTDGIDGVLRLGPVLICDRDRRWSGAALEFLKQKLSARPDASHAPVRRRSGHGRHVELLLPLPRKKIKALYRVVGR
jgi:hypothetical protein